MQTNIQSAPSYRQVSPINRTTLHAIPSCKPRLRAFTSLSASKSPSNVVAQRQLIKLQPDLVASGGLDPQTQPSESRASFAKLLSQNFVDVDVNFPGLRILNIDPPVLVVEDFLPHDTCDKFIEAAKATGKLKRSAVGGQGYADQTQTPPQGAAQQPQPTGTAQQQGSSTLQPAPQAQPAPAAAPAPAPQSIRTSSTLALTQDVLNAHPDLQAELQELLRRAAALLQMPASMAEASRSCIRPTEPGEMTFELPQVAHYQKGQHFLSHEDAFPGKVALEKGYQRRATLLVYLNGVQEGGATYFDLLELGVTPRKGSALLFFPSFAGGVPDARTLHTAQPPIDEKWITQLWVSVGVAKRQPTPVGRSLPELSFTGKSKSKRKRK